MTDPELLKSFVEEYQLEVDGVKFWTPYYISERRENVAGVPIVGAFKGRGTPGEIYDHLMKYLDGTPKKPRTSEDYRKFMRSIRLGIECSGFAYYMLSNLLKKQNINIDDSLFKSREQMLAIYDNPKLVPPKTLAREAVVAYADWVPLSQIEKDWGNRPRNIIESQTFWNDGSSNPLASLLDLRAGDLIGMMGYDGIGHHVLVVNASSKKVEFAHSGGTHGRFDYHGGVEYGTIEIVDPHLPIEEQRWLEGAQLIVDEHQFSQSPLRRLKVLDV